MALLAIETATKQMGVAVIEGEKLLSGFELLADYPHAVELPGAVDRVLKASKLSIKELDGFIVDIGPGSFTGLRIGLAFLKALAYVSRKPVVAVSSLDVLASGFTFAPVQVCPVLDAKQKNIYAALYDVKGPIPKRESDFFLGPLSGWLPRIKQKTLFLGDGAEIYRDQIRDQAGAFAEFAPADASWPRVSLLARIGAERFKAGKLEDPATLIPLYLYPLDCSVRGPDRPTSILPALSSAGSA